MLGSPVVLCHSPTLLLQCWVGTAARSQEKGEGEEWKRKGEGEERELQAAAYLASPTSRRSMASSAQNTEPKLLFPAESQVF